MSRILSQAKFGLALPFQASIRAMSKSARTHLVSGCPIRVSFPTAMVRARLTQLAKECREIGSVAASGAMVLNLIDHSEPPGITAHRAVHVGGALEGKTVLVQGGVGAVGACAVQLAHQAGTRVMATCRAESDKGIALRAGADEVLLTGENLVGRIKELAPDGVDHVVEVAFGANIKTDMEVLAQGGSISTYATNAPKPEIPFWELVFVNGRIFFVGSDDVPAEAKIEATRDINQALEAGWQGLDIAEIAPLDQIARSHELVEHPMKPGRVIVALSSV
jgi:NADPH2:quinone reductase